jgi:hypothetical protein
MFDDDRVRLDLEVRRYLGCKPVESSSERSTDQSVQQVFLSEPLNVEYDDVSPLGGDEAFFL